MTISLYDCTVASFLQTLGAVSGFLERGLGYCRDKGIDPESIVETCIFDDMAPFRFQIISVAHHSAGALDGAKAGVFRPPAIRDPLNYVELQGLVADARAKLQALTPDEVNALEGKDMVFQLGERSMPFTVEGFLLSFSTPNLHFHATTAYDILRSKGAPIGKRDYMGQLRLKAA